MKGLGLIRSMFGGYIGSSLMVFVIVMRRLRLMQIDEPTTTHRFSIRGTGHPVDSVDEHGKFLGTVFTDPFVWHVFDRGEV